MKWYHLCKNPKMRQRPEVTTVSVTKNKTLHWLGGTPRKLHPFFFFVFFLSINFFLFGLIYYYAFVQYFAPPCVATPTQFPD